MVVEAAVRERGGVGGGGGGARQRRGGGGRKRGPQTVKISQDRWRNGCS